MRVSPTHYQPVKPRNQTTFRHADTTIHSVTLLGTLRPTASDILDAAEAKPAILRIERTTLPSFSNGLIATTKLIETTDIVSSLYSLVSPPL